MATKKARLVLPSERLQREEERVSEILRLTDAKTSHEQAVDALNRKIEEYSATLATLDGLFEAAQQVPQFTIGYAEAVNSNRSIGQNMSSLTTIHDIRQHVSHVSLTAKASIEVRLKECRDQLAIARQNLVGINTALAALEAEAA